MERFEANLGWVVRQLRDRSPAVQLVALAASPEQKNAAPTAEHLAATELMLAFESLGERCDFGAVQRKFGVEPLGLLRFAFTNFEPLIAALEDRFSAIGTAEDTGFELYKDENIVRMRRYGLIFHTFVYQRDLPTLEKREAFQSWQLQRLVFLKNKLITDLEDFAEDICLLDRPAEFGRRCRAAVFGPAGFCAEFAALCAAVRRRSPRRHGRTIARQIVCGIFSGANRFRWRRSTAIRALAPALRTGLSAGAPSQQRLRFCEI